MHCAALTDALEVIAVRPGKRPRPRGASVKVFDNLSEFVAAAGSQLGPTEWMEITQDRVNLFADATDDHQWIHIDPERAAAGP